MPSQESSALATSFTQIKQHFPADLNKDRFTARALYDQLDRCATEIPGVSYEDITVAGRPAKWLRPVSSSPNCAILYLHGGGFVMGSLISHRKLAAHLAKAANVPVLMHDYRLAPESPYPAAYDDCLAAYKWLIREKGYEAKSIATAGDSCGGNLATAIALMARRDSLPTPGAVVSLSPWYDLENTGATLQTNAHKDALGSKESVDGLVRIFTKDQTLVSARDPMVSAIHAELKGLPPHYITVGTCDTLEDNGGRLAELLEKAGVEVVYKTYEEQQHVFEFMAGKAPEATESIQSIGAWLKEKLGKSSG